MHSILFNKEICINLSTETEFERIPHISRLIVCILGVNNVLTTAMAVDLVGMDHMGTVMSLGMMGSGLAVLTLVPFAGDKPITFYLMH